jgi:hypothetical protein
MLAIFYCCSLCDSQHQWTRIDNERRGMSEPLFVVDELSIMMMKGNYWIQIVVMCCI